MGPCVDPETGLQYLRARYYDPTTGQFLTRDPLQAITRQPYSYALDNPINNTDPSGLCDVNPFASDSCVGDAAGAVGSGLSTAAGAVGSGLSTAAGAVGAAGGAVGTFVGNHYGQIAEGLAAGACLTEVVGPVSCLLVTGGAFGASTYQTVTDECLSSGQKAAGVLLDALGTVPGAQAAGLEAGGLLGTGAGKTALNVFGGVVGGSAIVGGPAIVSAAGSGPGCGCS